MQKCSCHSGNSYEECCKPFHLGKDAPGAEKLMRSRFCAYALNLPDYIIKTTHPGSSEFSEDKASWRQSISAFSRSTEFNGLEVFDFQEHGSMARVYFVAHLKQKKEDATFTEKSYFEKLQGKWYYKSGQLVSGHAPNLITTSQMRVLPLAYYGNPILRKKADPISEINESVAKLADEMIETMDACDGLGLAAPQVHHSIQMFVIRQPTEDKMGHISLGEAKVFINPKISDLSQETWDASEGCLSIPGIHADVARPKEIMVEYTNLEGIQVKERVSGWEARVILHENDHIQGVLFIDHLSEKKRESLEPFLQRMNRRIHDGTEL